MLRLSITPHWVLHTANADHALPRLIALLEAIQQEHSMTAAAARLGISYRSAWDLIRWAHREFGAPLADMGRGRPAKLSVLGARLVSADRRIKARIAPLLDGLASELESEIVRSRSGGSEILRIDASHGYAIELMRGLLLKRNVPLDLRYRGSMEALASLASGTCEVAGFHTPLGELQTPVLQFHSRWLDPANQVLINLVTRRVGLMVAPRNPKSLLSLADLTRPGVRFVNRQFGSGTRILLDLLLKREGIDSGAIAGYGSGEFTHSAVAAFVASDLADAGFGVEAGARQFNLEFFPIATERYFLVCARESLETRPLKRILETLSSRQFRTEASRLAGIDAARAGTTLEILDAFPELLSPAAARGEPRRPLVRQAK